MIFDKNTILDKYHDIFDNPLDINLKTLEKTHNPDSNTHTDETRDFLKGITKKSKIIKKITNSQLVLKPTLKFIDFTNIQKITLCAIENTQQLANTFLEICSLSSLVHLSVNSDSLHTLEYISHIIMTHTHNLNTNQTIKLFFVSNNDLSYTKLNINQIVQYIETHDLIFTESVLWFKYVICSLCLLSKTNLIQRIKLFNYNMLKYHDVELPSQLVFVNKPFYSYVVLLGPFEQFTNINICTNSLQQNINSIHKSLVQLTNNNFETKILLVKPSHLELDPCTFKPFVNCNVVCIDTNAYEKLFDLIFDAQTIIYDSNYWFCPEIITFSLYNSVQIIDVSNNYLIEKRSNIEKLKNLMLEQNSVIYIGTIREWENLDNMYVQVPETEQAPITFTDNIEHMLNIYDKHSIQLHIILIACESDSTMLCRKQQNDDRGTIYMIKESSISQLYLYMEKIIKTNIKPQTLVISSQLEKIIPNPYIGKITKYFQNTYYTGIEFFTKYCVSKQIRIFINYQPEQYSNTNQCTYPYGGGNQFVKNIIEYIESFSYMTIGFDLNTEPYDVYLIIDIRKGKYKKYTYDEILQHKTKYGGKIVYRINDCDFTRQTQTLEEPIIKYLSTFDMVVFNSRFIKDYYFDKYDFTGVKYRIVYNTANSKYFFPKEKCDTTHTHISICTHHWSDNIYKGYDFYYKMHDYCKNVINGCIFKFYGRKFNDEYTGVEVLGPYAGMEMGDVLRENDIYITGSMYDACPMHLLEALSCGLPVLYYDCEGGVKNICEMGEGKIGEPFVDYKTMIEGLEKIKSNYAFYRECVLKNIHLYNSQQCVKSFVKIFCFM